MNNLKPSDKGEGGADESLEVLWKCSSSISNCPLSTSPKFGREQVFHACALGECQIYVAIWWWESVYTCSSQLAAQPMSEGYVIAQLIPNCLVLLYDRRQRQKEELGDQKRRGYTAILGTQMCEACDKKKETSEGICSNKKSKCHLHYIITDNHSAHYNNTQ